MEKLTEQGLRLQMAEAFAQTSFLQKLGMNRAEASRFFSEANWPQVLSLLLPMETRVSCGKALVAFSPCWSA